MKNKYSIYKFFCMACLLMGSLSYLTSCTDESDESIDENPTDALQLSLPGFEDVMVRSDITDSKDAIRRYDVYIYDGAVGSVPILQKTRKSTTAGEAPEGVIGNGSITPLILKGMKYEPKNGDRIYVILNIDDASGEKLTENLTETDLKAIEMVAPVTGSTDYTPYTGSVTWNDKKDNSCMMYRVCAAVKVDISKVGSDVTDGFGTNVIVKMYTLNTPSYSTLFGTTPVSYIEPGYNAGIMVVNGEGQSGDEIRIPEYQSSVHSPMNGGFALVANTYNVSRPAIIMQVGAAGATDDQCTFYRMDFYDKVYPISDITNAALYNKYLDLKRGYRYIFTVTKVLSKGYSTLKEAMYQPGSNLEYQVKVDDSWSAAYEYNGQYQVNINKASIDLLKDLSDTTYLATVKLSNNVKGQADFTKLTTHTIKLLDSSGNLVPTSNIQLLLGRKDLKDGFQVVTNNTIDSIPFSTTYSDTLKWNLYCVAKDATVGTYYLNVKMGNLTRDITVTKSTPTKYTYLDSKGTANSYITPLSSGNFKFRAGVMGGGTSCFYNSPGFVDANGVAMTSPNIPTDVAKAKLIWQDTPGLITQVGFTSGGADATKTIVTFKKGTGQGNAIIAVYSPSGQIYWSWHIWCTDTPEVFYLKKSVNGYTEGWTTGLNYYMMDRNLGSLNMNGSRSVGMFYQWGRKDPFLPPAELTSGYSSAADIPAYDMLGRIIKQKIAIINKLGAEMKDPISYSISNPNSFYNADDAATVNDYKECWLGVSLMSTTIKGLLWGTSTVKNTISTADNVTYLYKTSNFKKSIYDPCPVGYMIPQSDFIRTFIKTDTIIGTIEIGYAQSYIPTPFQTTDNKSGFDFYINHTSSGSLVHFPPRLRKALNGGGGTVGTSGVSVWCSDVQVDNKGKYYPYNFIVSTKKNLNSIVESYFNYAQQVRCVREVTN